jgi:tripartite-type tricarboxylate transporter receptor subunit TctC
LSLEPRTARRGRSDRRDGDAFRDIIATQRRPPRSKLLILLYDFSSSDGANLPYKGTSGVMSDLLGNYVSAMFVPTHVALPLAAAGQIRILGVASAERVTAAPEVPTLAEQGVTGFEVDLWFGLLAPAGTPTDVVARYNAAINEFLGSPAVAGALAKQGLITAGGSPAVLAELIARDMAKWHEVIERAGITAE